MRVATLDIGTNTLLLLIAERGADGTWRAVHERMRIEGLGKGVDRTGRLDPTAVAGALDAVDEYAQVIREAGVSRVAAVGTQALREVANAAEFVRPAEEKLGCEIEIVTGEREADLSFLAVARSLPAGRGELLVFDVGGGSTELIEGRGGRRVSARSVPVGSVRMTERCLTGDPPTPAEVVRLAKTIDLELGAVPRASTVVGVAGTVTTLAAVALGLDDYDGARVHGLTLSREQIEAQLARFATLPLAERAALPGMPPKRAPFMVAGAAIVSRVMAGAGAKELVVSDRGVRWGLVYEIDP